AEARVGIKRLGVSLEQTGSVDGWAGAGVRGELRVEHVGSKLSWQTGWGAALGLGGAAGWGGTIDVAGVSPRHRAVAREVIAAALSRPLPFIGPLPVRRFP
ncbi:MAG: hypothetical protein JWN41_1073, partial [Thermoleophilia bacterium]|nr:hypothetical protein [Thermoleophilia bacterium]